MIELAAGRQRLASNGATAGLSAGEAGSTLRESPRISPHDAPGLIAACAGSQSPVARPTAHAQKCAKHSLAAVKRGRTLRRMETETGINRGRLSRLFSGAAVPTRQERQLLRSSEPKFLRHVQQIAVPFLQSRIGDHHGLIR